MRIQRRACAPPARRDERHLAEAEQISSRAQICATRRSLTLEIQCDMKDMRSRAFPPPRRDSPCRFPPSNLSRTSLLEQLKILLARHRLLTAEVLHVLAEVDRRRLWAEAGYSSLYAFCVGELGLAEDAAFRRMRAARMARRYPVILDMVADGRLHLSALVLLHPHIKPWNATDLLAAATRKTKHEIRTMLAERYPQDDVKTQVRPVRAAAGFQQRTAESAGNPAVGSVAEVVEPLDELAPEPVAGEIPEPARGIDMSAHSVVAPLAPQRYSVQFTMDEEMHADLIRAQELLGPQADGDRVRSVFRRALRELVTNLEKRKFAATDKPRIRVRQAVQGRQIPSYVKREVRERDQGQCTFVAENGKRCGSRSKLEFDHVVPVAKGGMSTVENIRLLCRAHNQLEADHAFGAGFMHEIRERARAAVARDSCPPAPVARAVRDPLSCAPAHAADAVPAPPCP
jgi:5-methylcytosine-specific restriction endonuclease McrA